MCVDFDSFLPHNAALTGVAVNCNISPPGVTDVLCYPVVAEDVIYGLVVQYDPACINRISLPLL